MPDIGLGEVLLMAALALLIFGPERLPKVAADAARTLRQVRRMATDARRDLADAAGLESDPELASAVRELRDLDPRRVLEPLDEPDDRPASGKAASASGAAPVTPAAPAQPAPAPATTPAVDPDWT